MIITLNLELGFHDSCQFQYTYIGDHYSWRFFGTFLDHDSCQVHYLHVKLFEKPWYNNIINVGDDNSCQVKHIMYEDNHNLKFGALNS